MTDHTPTYNNLVQKRQKLLKFLVILKMFAFFSQRVCELQRIKYSIRPSLTIIIICTLHSFILNDIHDEEEYFLVFSLTYMLSTSSLITSNCCTSHRILIIKGTVYCIPFFIVNIIVPLLALGYNYYYYYFHLW